MKLSENMLPDGRIFNISTDEPTTDQDIIEWLKSENAYLKGKIKAYEQFLKAKGYIKEEK